MKGEKDPGLCLDRRSPDAVRGFSSGALPGGYLRRGQDGDDRWDLQASLSLGWGAKFYEIAPYVSQRGCGVFGAMDLDIRKDLFDSLPKDLQKVILDWGPKGQEQSVDIVMEEKKSPG